MSVFLQDTAGNPGRARVVIQSAGFGSSCLLAGHSVK